MWEPNSCSGDAVGDWLPLQGPQLWWAQGWDRCQPGWKCSDLRACALGLDVDQDVSVPTRGCACWDRSSTRTYVSRDGARRASRSRHWGWAGGWGRRDPAQIWAGQHHCPRADATGATLWSRVLPLLYEPRKQRCQRDSGHGCAQWCVCAGADSREETAGKTVRSVLGTGMGKHAQWGAVPGPSGRSSRLVLGDALGLLPRTCRASLGILAGASSTALAHRCAGGLPGCPRTLTCRRRRKPATVPAPSSVGEALTCRGSHQRGGAWDAWKGATCPAPPRSAGRSHCPTSHLSSLPTVSSRSVDPLGHTTRSMLGPASCQAAESNLSSVTLFWLHCVFWYSRKIACFHRWSGIKFPLRYTPNINEGNRKIKEDSGMSLKEPTFEEVWNEEGRGEGRLGSGWTQNLEEEEAAGSGCVLREQRVGGVSGPAGSPPSPGSCVDMPGPSGVVWQLMAFWGLWAASAVGSWGPCPGAWTGQMPPLGKHPFSPSPEGWVWS